MSYKILANGNVMAPPRELPNAGEYDVVVCGGGMAGFGAALAAARHSASVLIIERRPHWADLLPWDLSLSPWIPPQASALK